MKIYDRDGFLVTPGTVSMTDMLLVRAAKENPDRVLAFKMASAATLVKFNQTTGLTIIL